MGFKEAARMNKGGQRWRTRAICLTSLLALAGSSFAARSKPAAAPAPSAPPLPEANPAPAGKLNVLFLGDSLALCGFGKHLDFLFRNDPKVNATFSYMTCGTNPLSWLKEKPYSNVRTQCGYWSIESLGQEPREMQDVYGMSPGHVPKAHLVPKLEELLDAAKPDVLVVQTGSNLFGLFPDAKSVHVARHTAELRKYLQPFKEKAISGASPIKKIYWVNPPTSGRVAPEVQDFLLQQVQENLGPEVQVIDSRKLVTYPYQHMEPDKEHFLGAQMDEWADKVYAIIQQDLAQQPIAALQPLGQGSGPIARAEPVPQRAEAVALRAEPVAQRAEPVSTPAPVLTPAPPPKKFEPLIVKATLVFKSAPMQLRELLPYQEALVAYVYRVDKVVRGQYADAQILVMHPAFIGLKPQKLEKFRLGKRYKLRLHPLEGTLWNTAKMRDETGQINLTPFIPLEDLAKHPNHR